MADQTQAAVANIADIVAKCLGISPDTLRQEMAARQAAARRRIANSNARDGKTADTFEKTISIRKEF